MAPKKIYWDSSCFISYLSGGHKDEIERAAICEDVLKHARNDEIEIWTSVWTIVETIRPKEVFKPTPLPLWAELLNTADDKGKIIHPQASGEFEKIWTYFHKHTLPTRPLSEEVSAKIKAMFDWSWIRKIQVTPAISYRAAEIVRTHNMKCADAVHVASALSKNCDVIHRWDRDYKKADKLIPSEEPVMMSSQPDLF